MFAKTNFPVRQPLVSLGGSEKHGRRVKLLLLICSGVTILLGAAWGGYYATLAKWWPTAMNLMATIIGGLAMAYTQANRLRAAAILLVPALFVLLCAFCLLVDIPGDGVPRCLHMYLLSLGAGAFLVFRGEKAHLRVGLPLLCCAACLIFGSSDIGFPNPAFMPPPEIRSIGVWINNAASIITLAIVMTIMQADVAVRNAIEADLRQAVDQGHFVLHFQSQVSEDGRIIGAETLLRWDHPERGMIPPAKFIAVAEETGLIVPIGEWVLRKACAQLVVWAADPRTSGLTLAVNVSAKQFSQPDFVQKVLGIVERSGIQPSRLKLELTESMLVKDIKEIINKMAALQAHGVTFSLDDFGTGFSSLSYLKHLPLDQLKIDQSFVRDLLTDPSDMAIVRTLISLGESLDLMVIAEGVETEGQRAWLRANGCRAYQGYLFSKPVPIDQFEALLAQTDPKASLDTASTTRDAAHGIHESHPS